MRLRYEPSTRRCSQTRRRFFLTLQRSSAPHSSGLMPKLEPKEIAVRQAQHTLAQTREARLWPRSVRRCDNLPSGCQRAREFRFLPKRRSASGESRFCPTGPAASEGFVVGVLIGHIQGTAVQTNHPPTPVPGPFGGFCGDGANYLVMQLLDRLSPNLVWACEIPDLPVTLIRALGLNNH